MKRLKKRLKFWGGGCIYASNAGGARHFVFKQEILTQFFRNAASLLAFVLNKKILLFTTFKYSAFQFFKFIEIFQKLKVVKSSQNGTSYH